MADTPVDPSDTVDNPTTSPDEAAPAAAPDGEAPAEKPARKKPAKKAAAKRKPAKKAAAKPKAKAAAKKATAEESPAAEEPPAAEAPVEEAPVEEAPAAEAPAAEAPAEDEQAAATMPLFKAPEPVTTTRRRRKPAAKPVPDEDVAEPTEASAAAPVADVDAPTADADPTAAADAAADDAEDATAMVDGAETPDAQTADAQTADAQTADTETADTDGATDDATNGDEGDDSDDSDDSDAEGESGNGGGRRRRRRGGRRRRKSGGGNAADSADSADGDTQAGGDDQSAAAQDGQEKQGKQAKQGKPDGDRPKDESAADDDAGEGGQSSSSRRRRRRRREGDAADNGSDEPGTVTRVRKARSAEDEITAVSGSTRLEAKKQRRREGREAGRRRAPIISEAEFLARRESVDRVMVVRQREDLTQIAVLEDKVLVEHYVARESQTSLIGNVYVGRVQNVLPSMEAAFIDIGKGRNAVLYAGEVNWSALGHKEGEPRKIESVLQSGQTVLVQVTKDPVGHKGARLTSQISLAGRFLVYVPDGTTSGISRKLPDTERARLKTLLKEIVPESAGVIVRTAAEGASEEELTRDVERLKARWEDIEAKSRKGGAPQLLYGEPDLTLKVVRDLFTEDFAKLVVQGDDAWETVRGYVEHVAPDLADRLEHYRTDVDGESRPDVFAAYRIDEQIAKGLDRKVWLPSGGSLIIDRTEAMTVIDVNTGKFTGSGGNLEETVTKNNLEAAEEIVRQLRLRDIGGIIVVDFIDMVLESNRDLVLRRLVECLGRDRTRHQVAEVTSLGLVQMTRKRIGTGLLEAFSETCDHCQGRGLVVHDLPVEPRRGGDEESRRGGRRRRGKGGSQAEEAVSPKAVPSPKDVAAMAKPPSDEPEEPQQADEAEQPEPARAVQPEQAVQREQAEQPQPEQPQPEQPRPEVAEQAATEPVEQPVEAPAEVAPVEEPPAEETPPAPVTKVVTRTRRRAASRPAGPPVVAEEPAATDGQAAADDADATDEPAVEHVPVKKRGPRKR